jgi:tRNA(Ile2) C34 agmatinyltransferase TiaS
MLKEGDKLICISNNRCFTFKKYATFNSLKVKTHIVLEEHPTVSININKFIPYNYRKEKLLKLKENICLKKVIF